MTLKIEEITLSNLIINEPYTRKVLPFIKDDYFDAPSHKILFSTLSDYVNKFETTPEPVSYTHLTLPTNREV